MGLFDKKPKVFKGIAPPKIRVEKVPVPQRKLAPKGPSRASSHSSSPRPSPQPSSRADDAPRNRKRKAAPAQKRISPVASSRVDFGSDSGSEDDEDWVKSLDSRKRRKRGRLEDGRYVDPNRRLVDPRALKGVVEGEEVIHAAEVASVELKCEPVLGAKEGEVGVELRYPSMQKPER